MRRLLPLMLLFGCDSEDVPAICDATSLTDALSAAAPSERIAIGACRIEGDFVLPPGVVLAGMDPTSRIAGRDLALTTTGEARIEDLSIEAGTRAGVLLRGGPATVARVRIDAATGVALAAEGLPLLVLEQVTVRGPIDATNQAQIPYPPDRRQTATHGIVAVQVADLELTDVSASGFAGAGLLLVDSEARWTRGDANENLGLGLHVQGGRAVLTDVSLAQTFRGTWGIETYGGAFTSSAAIESTNLTVDDNWYGLLHHGGTARHSNLSASGNQNAGVWVQFSRSFELQGTISDNDFAGLVAFESSGLFIHDSRIEDTQQVLRPRGETGTVMIGDGIQLVESTDGARLMNLDLVDNQRIGLLIELGGGTYDAMEMSNVRISQSTGSGAVVQHGTAPSDWDDGIIRNGVTQAADRAVTNLDFADVVGPCGRPDEHRGLSEIGL